MSSTSAFAPQFFPHTLFLGDFLSCPHCKRTLFNANYVGQHLLSAENTRTFGCVGLKSGWKLI